MGRPQKPKNKVLKTHSMYATAEDKRVLEAYTMLRRFMENDPKFAESATTRELAMLGLGVVHALQTLTPEIRDLLTKLLNSNLVAALPGHPHSDLNDTHKDRQHDDSNDDLLIAKPVKTTKAQA